MPTSDNIHSKVLLTRRMFGRNISNPCSRSYRKDNAGNSTHRRQPLDLWRSCAQAMDTNPSSQCWPSRRACPPLVAIMQHEPSQTVEIHGIDGYNGIAQTAESAGFPANLQHAVAFLHPGGHRLESCSAHSDCVNLDLRSSRPHGHSAAVICGPEAFFSTAWVFPGGRTRNRASEARRDYSC
jgi:hypothetical protein